MSLSIFFSVVVDGGKEWIIAFIIILVLARVVVCVCFSLYKRTVCAKCKQSIREGIFILSFKTTKSFLVYKNGTINYFKTNVIAWYTWKPPQTVFFFFWTVFFRFLPAKCHNQNGKFIHKKMQNSPNLKKKIKFQNFLLFLFYVYF